MSAVLAGPVRTSMPASCPDCDTRAPRNRWGAPLPKKFPATLTPEHVDATLGFHPWLRGTRLAAMAENLRDGVVMGA